MGIWQYTDKDRADYHSLVLKIHGLIMGEIYENKYISISGQIQESEDKKKERIRGLATLYPKVIIMYYFFRMLRGEAFLSIPGRPDTPNYQEEFREFENEILQGLNAIKKELLESNDTTAKETTQTNLEMYKKLFTL